MSLTTATETCQERSLPFRAIAAWQEAEARRRAEDEAMQRVLNDRQRQILAAHIWDVLKVAVKPETIEVEPPDDDSLWAWTDIEGIFLMLDCGRLKGFTRCQDCGAINPGWEITSLVHLGGWLQSPKEPLCRQCRSKSPLPDPFAEDRGPERCYSARRPCDLIGDAALAKILAEDALSSGKAVDLAEAAEAFARLEITPHTARELPSEGVKACRIGTALQYQFAALAFNVKAHEHAHKFMIPATPSETDPRLTLSAFSTALQLWAAQVEGGL
jgi:hypothetical protein